MERAITDTLQLLLFPPGLFFTLGPFIWWVVKRYPTIRAKILWTTVAVAYVASCKGTGMLLLTALESYPATTPNQLIQQGVQAIVVLTGGMYTGPEYGKPTTGGDSLPRLNYAVYLHRQTNLPIVIVGGKTNEKQPVSLARAMADTLRDEYAITQTILEERSRTTAEHALYLPPILADHGLHRVAVVTHAWHIPRAIEIFHRGGIDAVAAPTQFTFGKSYGSWIYYILPSPDGMNVLDTALHEWAGRLWYRLRY